MTTDTSALDACRPALLGHCYRMLGSAFDADDAVQETMVRAWRSLGEFDGRASLKTWLYRIATNVCLDELRSRGRRALPIGEGEPGPGAPPIERLTQRAGSAWIEPMPDARVLPASADPAERAMLRQSIRLAFVAALQTLPPKQRAALLLIDVVGYPAGEAAEALGLSVASLNSALQRARAAMAQRGRPEPAELSESQQRMLGRYVEAFESYDVDGLTALMREDATFCMPPYELWLRGPADVRTWMLGLGSGCRGSRLLAREACGLPAFGQYRPDADGGYKAWALIVLDLAGDRIGGLTSFLDVERVFPHFELPLRLGA